VTQKARRDVTRALPAWVNPRWANDAPAVWAADMWECVRVVQTHRDTPALVLVKDINGYWFPLDWTTARALLALLGATGG